MDPTVTYQRHDSIATITMDDGKVNALSPRMISQINQALDRAEADAAVVVLAGRTGVFSGGFDLSVLRGGDEGALAIRPARPAADPEPEIAGDIELALEVVDHPRAFDVEAAARDQRSALAPRAEALREEEVGRLHRPAPGVSKLARGRRRGCRRPARCGRRCARR